MSIWVATAEYDSPDPIHALTALAMAAPGLEFQCSENVDGSLQL